mgnify:CR=1 FL=1
MSWKNIVKQETKQGPRRNFKMLEELNLKELENMENGLMQIAGIFNKNAKYLKQLVGKEEAQEVVEGIAGALRIYSDYLLYGVGDSTDNVTSGGDAEGYGEFARRNAESRKYLERQAKEYTDLADDLMGSIR